MDNFEEHVKLMEWFHRRYIASRRAIELWAKRIEGLEINIVAPQHGSIFMGENAKKFLNWLKNLDKVGVDFISSNLDFSYFY